MPEQAMPALAVNAVNEHEITHYPADRFDRLLGDDVAIVKKGHVRTR